MCDGVGGGPGGLEIEAASDAVDVENLASKIETGNEAAFKCLGIDAAERNAAAGDKLVLEGCTACYLASVVAQYVDKAVHVLFAQFVPAEGGALVQGRFQ